MRDILPMFREDKEESEMIKVRKGGRVRQRQRKKALIQKLSHDMIGALNFLYGVEGQGGSQDSPNRLHQSALHYLLVLGEEVCRRGLARQEATSVINDPDMYLQGVQEEGIWLDVNKVSLPLNEVAGSVEMTSLLPEAMKVVYEDNRTIEAETGEPIEWRKPFRGVKSGHYEALIHRLEKNGMVRLQQEKPRVINGVFGVPKQDK